MVSWQKIRTEYVTSGISYRALAKKHGVPLRTLSTHAHDENWVQKREQHRNTVATKTQNAIAEKETDRAVNIQETADMLLSSLQKVIKTYTDMDEPIPTRSLRELTGALKDIKEIQNVRSELDEKEQKARIKAIEAKANTHDVLDGQEFGVVLLPKIEPLTPPPLPEDENG